MIYDNYERELVCALMQSQATPDAIEVLGKIKPEMFNKGSFREMYKAILDLYNKGIDFDAFNVAGKAGFNDMDVIEMLKNSVGHARSVKLYAKKVRQGFYLRKAESDLTRVLEKIRNCNDESMMGEIFEDVESVVKTLVVETDNKKPVVAGELAENYIKVFEDRFNGGESDKRLKFGIEAIDERTGGINPTDLMIMAGCPGMGKTELLVKLANQVSDEEGGALAFSMEMSDSEWIERSIAMESGISITDIRNPRGMSQESMGRLTMGLGVVKDKKFHVLDQAGLSIDEICAQATEHKTRFPKTKLICLDYAGLVRFKDNQEERRALGEVAKRLKQLAKQLQTPVILLSQVVSKDIEKRPDKRPMASDLKGSSELQDAADWIVFPYRDVVYNEDSPSADIAEVIFAKARHGKQGTAYMGWKNGHFVETDQAMAHNVSKEAKQPKGKSYNKDF
ncbi:MAG: hypothetical protein GY928_36365 [Colwellia sp.]|nr:hypothetical protein [Colwellia sp.]